MWRNYRECLSKFRHRVGELFKSANKKVTRSDIPSSYQPLINDNRHLEAIKSSCNRLGNSLHSRVDSFLDKASSIYDQISGRGVVNKALIELRQAEQDFVASQLKRRTLQQSLFQVQNKRSEVNKQLNVVSRADDSFITLITREHELAREEAQMASQHHEADLVERAAYDRFTSLLRYLHGEERLYDQRMRQWALFGSVAAGLFSAFVTWLRFRSPRTTDLQKSLSLMEEINSSQKEIKSDLVKMNEALQLREELPQLLKRINQLTTSQMEIMEKLKEFSAFNNMERVENAPSKTIESSSASQPQSDKLVSQLREPCEETGSDYFGWKSVCSAIGVVAIIVFLSNFRPS